MRSMRSRPHHDCVRLSAAPSIAPLVAVAGLMASLALPADLPAQRGYPGNFSPLNLAVGGTPPTAFFSAGDESSGIEPWAYDTGAGAPTRLANIVAGGTGSFPDKFTPIDNQRVFFTARTCSGTGGCTEDRELYYLDRSTMTAPVKFDVRPGAMGSFPMELTLVGTNVLFAADNGVSGRELWKCDGTTSTPLGNINPAGGSFPHNLIALGANVLFAAGDGTSGIELWISGGTAANTVLLKDIHGGGGGSFPGEMARLGNLVYFAATTAAEGRELWVTNGTPVGTNIVADIRGGTASSAPDQLTVDPLNGALAFTAVDGSGSRKLFIYKPPVGLLAIPIPNGGSIAHVVAAGFPDPGGSFWCTSNLPGEGLEPSIVMPGSLPPTFYLPLPIVSGAVGSSPRALRPDPVSFNLLCRAEVGTTGAEPWRFNGAWSLLKDIKPNAGAAGLARTSTASPMVRFGSEFLFAAEDGANGRELWRTNGTTAGTVMVSDSDLDPVTHTTNVHLSTNRIEVTEAVPNSLGLLMFGLSPLPNPFPFPGVRGALLLSPAVSVPFPFNASGEFTLVLPPLPPVFPPVGVQSVQTSPSLTALSNLDPPSAGSCTLAGMTATGDGMVCDETGEYSVTINYSNGPATAYFALLYKNSAGEYEILTSTSIGDGSFSLEPGGSITITGFADLYPADDPGDSSFTKTLEVWMSTVPVTPSTPTTPGAGCRVWESYC
jgi:ELWxxDGT repeat protein